MAAKRVTAELLRVLHAVEAPLYLVDASHRLAFVNAACEAWLGLPAESLLDTECRYHSSPTGDLATEQAAALCPPPEAFLGHRATGWIVLPDPAGGVRHRQAEFLPLPGHGETAGVLVLVAPADEPPPTLPPAADLDRPDDTRLRLARFQRAQRDRCRLARVVGESLAAQRLRAQVRLAAAGDASVLLVGPAGSGRQHLAQVIHYAWPGERRLVPLACRLLSAELLADALRGCGGESNAATTTLLLERADLLEPQAQAELAAFLAAGPRRRLLSTAEESLAALAAAGRFRADLAQGLSTLEIPVPALAARLEDLPLFAQLFLEETNAGGQKQLQGFTAEAIDLLAAAPWPGNLDELRAVVRAAHAAAAGPLVAAGDMPRELHLRRAADAHPPRVEETIVLDEFLGQIERELIERALARAQGNKAHAARLLGLTRPRLYRRLEQLGLIEPGTANDAEEPG